MKKYLLGIVAILLAIGLNALTTKNKSSANTSEIKRYWYLVEFDGSQYLMVDYLGYMNKTEAQGVTLCPTLGIYICAKGFTLDIMVERGGIIPGGNDFLFQLGFSTQEE